MSKPIEKMLTGNIRTRTSILGKEVLQVEVTAFYECPHDFTESPPFTYWRDAKRHDVTSNRDRAIIAKRFL